MQVGLIQLAEGLKSKNRFARREGILHADHNMESLPEFPAYQSDFRLTIIASIFARISSLLFYPANLESDSFQSCKLVP